MHESKVKTHIENKDFDSLDRLLSQKPKMANKGITIPFDPLCMVAAHPLHRICDTVFTGKISDEEAMYFAEILLAHGANIDGDKHKGGGTPLLAAASLHAEKTGIFYIEKGADVNYQYEKDGASALHWASFCGRDKLVDKLIKAQAEIDPTDYNYLSTPLGWALHALHSQDKLNAHHQKDCVKLLLTAGADRIKLPDEARTDLKALADEDHELKSLL